MCLTERAEGQGEITGGNAMQAKREVAPAVPYPPAAEQLPTGHPWLDFAASANPVPPAT